MTKQREKISLTYLTEIDVIKEYLVDSQKSEKTLNTYLKALNMFFPFLVNRLNENVEEAKNFDLDAYNNVEPKTAGQNKIKQEWIKKGIHNKVFNEWRKLNPNKKANILIRWANETSKKSEKTDRNTYINYVWRIQGLLSKIGRDYEANPKNIEAQKINGYHFDDTITYEDVIKLYESFPNHKYKLILKIMMYTGLNPADIVLLRPMDFQSKKDEATEETYYIVIKDREKTKNKDTQFLITFQKIFVDEIRAYYERKIKKHIKKVNVDKINKFKTDKHFRIVEDRDNYIVFEGQYNWANNKKENIFKMTPSVISDTFKYHINLNNLNPDLMPQNIRRLCFTKLKAIFSLEDRDVYLLWTQHKAGTIDKNYILDMFERVKPYFEENKIQQSILIGNMESIIKEVKGLRNQGSKIKELEYEIESLKSKFKILDEAIKQGMLIETFPDGVESGSPNNEPIADKYEKIPSKAGKEIAEFIIDEALDKTNNK